MREDADKPRSVPRAKPVRSGFPTWAWFAIGGGALLLFCCAGGTGLLFLGSRRTSGAGRDVAVGEEVRFGDIGVTVTSMSLQSFISDGRGGAVQHRPELVVQIGIKNHNPNRILNAGSQRDSARLLDDVGNTYRHIDTFDESNNRTMPRGQIPTGQATGVRSEKPQGDCVVFTRPVAGATTITVELDAAAYGGTGTIRVTVPREVFDPPVRPKKDNKKG